MKTPWALKSIKKFKNHSAQIPSCISGGDIDFKTGYFTGGNIFTTFFGGIFHTVYAAALCVVGLLALPVMACTESQYFGSFQFLFDSMKYFVDSVCKTARSALIIPELMHSKYYTGSWNVLKGEVRRELDTLEKLCTEKGTEPLLSNNAYPINYTPTYG